MHLLKNHLIIPFRRSAVLCLLLVCLTAVGQAHAQGSPAIIRTEPESLMLQAGQTYDVPIVLENAFEVFAIEVAMRFDPAVVEVLDANTKLDGVQILPGEFPKPDFAAVYAADNEAGTVSYIITQTNPTPPASGSGTVFTLQLRAKASGPSTLIFEKVEMANRDGILIDVTVKEEPIVVDVATRQATPTAVSIARTATPETAAVRDTPPAATAAVAAAAGSSDEETVAGAAAAVAPSPLPTLTAAAAAERDLLSGTTQAASGAANDAVQPVEAGSVDDGQNDPLLDTAAPEAQEPEATAVVEADRNTNQLGAGDQPPPAGGEITNVEPQVVGAAQQSPGAAPQQSPEATTTEATQQQEDSALGMRILLIVALLVLVVAALALALLLIRRSSSQH